MRKKLIEVAIPLDEINKASAREKSTGTASLNAAAPVVVTEAPGGVPGGVLRAPRGR